MRVSLKIKSSRLPKIVPHSVFAFLSQLFRRALCACLALAGVGFTSIAEEFPNDDGKWLSQVSALNTGDSRSFQFRTRIITPELCVTVYTSWAPPNHRSLIFSDCADGLPLIIVVDGDGWIYDLVGGQIDHFKSEPKLELRAKKDGAFFSLGITAPSQTDGIHIDLASLLQSPYITKLRAMKDENGRTAMGTTARGSEVILKATSSDPPLPLRLILQFPLDAARGHIECDNFHLGEPLPSWHHPLDPERLKQDVPYFDATNLNDLSKTQQELLEVTQELLAGEATFCLRPAIRDNALRNKLEQSCDKLDFKQIELHERFLKKAWLHALERQHCEPAKSFPSPSPSDTR